MSDPSKHKFRDGFNRWGVIVLAVVLVVIAMVLIGMGSACASQCDFSSRVTLPVPKD